MPSPAAAAAATVDDGEPQCFWSLTQEQIETSVAIAVAQLPERMTSPSLDSSSFAGVLVHGGASCRRRHRRFKKPGKGHMCHNLVSHASENTARSTRLSRRVGRDSGATSAVRGWSCPD